jgi:hypothetical protein
MPAPPVSPRWPIVLRLEPPRVLPPRPGLHLAPATGALQLEPRLRGVLPPLPLLASPPVPLIAPGRVGERAPPLVTPAFAPAWITPRLAVPALAPPPAAPRLGSPAPAAPAPPPAALPRLSPGPLQPRPRLLPPR